MLNVNNNIIVHNNFQPIVDQAEQVRNKIRGNATTAMVISVATILGGVGVVFATGNSNLLLKSGAVSGVIAGACMNVPLKDIADLIYLSGTGFILGSVIASQDGESDFHASVTGLITGMTLASILYVMKKQLRG